MNKNKWFLNGGRGSGRSFRLLCETYENKIAELEKENAELKQAKEGKVVEHFEAYGQCRDSRRIAELEAQLESERDLPVIAYMQGAEKQRKKDEAELKKWKDELQEQVQKATDEGYARTLRTMQLNKAKQFIRDFLSVAIDYIDPIDKNYSLIAEAEQFIRDSEVEK